MAGFRDVPISRRQLLLGAAAIGATAAAPGLLAGCSTASPSPSASPTGAAPSEAAWTALRQSLAGTLLRPGDAAYAAKAQPDNRRFAVVQPAGIVMCAGAQDVSTALLWARENGMPQVPRSGGHNYAGYSTTTGLQVDVSPMNSVAYRAGQRQIVAGGGSQNQDFLAAAKKSSVMIPGGQCLSVGAAGLTLGGGLGFSMRKYGVTSDSLVAAQAVLADGSIVEANSSTNSDLFWGLRGGAGGNFAIATELTFKAYPTQQVTHYWLQMPEGKIGEGITAWFGILASAPRSFGSIFYLTPGSDEEPKTVGGVVGQVYGTEAETRDILAPLLALGVRKAEMEITYGSYAESVEFLAPGPSDTSYYDKSRFIAEQLPGDAISKLIAACDARTRMPGTSGDIALFAWGGAIGDTPADATAMVHRDPISLLKISGVWTPGDAAATERQMSWVQESYDAMLGYCTDASFQNFPDNALQDWATAYYGSNLPRLVALKNQVDPDRVFNFPQAIPAQVP